MLRVHSNFFQNSQNIHKDFVASNRWKCRGSLIHLFFKETKKMEKQEVLNEKLLIAACLGNLEEVKQLISKGAEVNQKDDIGLVCFFFSYFFLLFWNYLPFLKYFLKTPLHKASKEGHLEVVKHILSCGSEVNSKVNSSKKALLNLSI